jgi:hypothetical protein
MFISQHLTDTYYFLLKDYGTTITVTKRVKSDVDPETGVRTAGDRSYTINAVFSPVGVFSEFLANLLGKVEKYSVAYMIQKSDLPEGIETTDQITHGNLKYRNLAYEDYDTVLLVSGEAFK